MGLSDVRGDEGMWIFNDLPRKLLQERYGFTPSNDWAEHIMKSSLRFNSGGSGSFVSSQGLVLTNHHVGAETLHKLSTPENNYYRDGFYAGTLEEEIPAPDEELNQLVEIEDVTERVNAAVKAEMSPGEAFAARNAVIAEIEKESFDRTGLRSNVVTLYGGGRYHLYRYQRYTDVRLVWAPEAAAAFFGGDADNFEYPRYCLDACLFRVYVDGKPAELEHHLAWSKNGAEDGELVFVSGNPGRTNRIHTVAALEHQRDVQLPDRLNIIRRLEIALQQFSLDGPEARRRGQDDLFSVQNSRKALTGMLRGLQDPLLMEAKRREELALKSALQEDERFTSYLSAWEAIAAAQQEKKRLSKESFRVYSTLFGIARHLVRLAEEDQKPNAERLPEYRESGRPSLEQQLFSTAPIYADLEQVKLAESLENAVEQMGVDSLLFRELLDGKNPQQRGAELIQGTELFDVEKRRELAEGGSEAIEASSDPLVRFARQLDEHSRRIRKQLDEINEIEQQMYAKISDALFALRGTSTYPDATFTLRLAFGTVKSYEEQGQRIPPWTDLSGAFAHEKHHGAADPWQLPESWHEKRDALDLSTPFNFVCTADIIGGNSGSPVVNKEGELVGLIFDGNIHSLTSDYIYTDIVARAVSVHSSAIREVLANIYGAERIVQELGK